MIDLSTYEKGMMKFNCFYAKVVDFMLGITIKKAKRDLFHDIGVKIQFQSEIKENIIHFKYLGVVKDYNGVNIIQKPD